MNSRILVLLLCVVAFSPIADAFSFDDVVEFFEGVFGPADITGMVPGLRCDSDLDCRAPDEVCYSGTCVQLCENERIDEECLKFLRKKEVRDPETYFCSLRVPIGRAARDICLQPTCGNEILEGSEACDDGNTNIGDGCGRRCLRVEPGWVCDNERMPSRCRRALAVCGDGRITGLESCDDGNTNSGDGCDRLCRIEVGWSCSGTPSRCAGICGDGRVVGNERCDDGDTTTEACGDREVNDGTFCNADCSATLLLREQCDDGNNANTDACLNTCVDASCGDSYVRSGVEQCDDGNSVQTDVCLNTCVAASCGDTHCYLSNEDSCGENTYCLKDCGICFEYTAPPKVDLRGIVSQVTPGQSNITINITNSTSCFYDLFQLTVKNEGTRRERTGKEKMRAGVKFDSCTSNLISNEINNIIDNLHDHTFEIRITATNNAGASDSSTGTFSLLGRTIDFKNIEPGEVFSELKKPIPKVKVSESKERCEYKIGGCDYTDVTESACSTDWQVIDPVNDFAQSCFSDGPNILTYKITNDDDTIETVEIRFLFIKSVEFFEQELKKKSGIRRRKQNPQTLYPVIIAQDTQDSPPKAINISQDVSLALAAAAISLENKRRISSDSWHKIFSQLKDKENIQKELGALRAAGVFKIKAVVVPAARIIADSQSSLVLLYESKVDEEGKTFTLTPQNVHKVDVNDSGDRRIITIHSNPVTIELGEGECKSVDINEDTYEDVIVCYDKEYGVTINNIVLLDEELESPIPEDATVISPITYSTVNEYVFDVDEKELEKSILEKVPSVSDIEKEIIRKYFPVIVIITIMMLYIIFVSSLSINDKIMKTKKKK